MINQWLDENGRKAIELMGWPERAYLPNYPLRLGPGNLKGVDDDYHFAWLTPFGEVHGHEADAVSLAVLSRWAVQDLVKRGAYIVPVWEGDSVLWTNGDWTTPDYDEALIAALLATEAPRG